MQRIFKLSLQSNKNIDKEKRCSAMSETMYAMQRANGEWFMTEIDGKRCLPVFRSFAAAQRVQARIADLMVYLAQPLDSRTLMEFSSSNGSLGYWLVDEFEPSPSMKPGRWLSASELATIGEDGDYAMTA
jgi:hypothetical protein